MSSPMMGDRDRRALTLGATVLIPALLFVWGVRPFLSALDTARQQVVVERETLAREQAVIAAARANPDLQRVADSAMRAMRPRLFEGRDDVMATAELVSHLGALTADHQVWMQDATTRPTIVGDGGVRHLRVEVRAESDLTGLLAFLQAIEQGNKLLRVERLDVSRSLAATGVEGVEPLVITATIVGFAIPEPPLAMADLTARGGATPDAGGAP